MDKISVEEYVVNQDKLEIVYIPYSIKVEIITKTIYEYLKKYGYINTSMVKLIAFQTYVGYITNLDMSTQNNDNLTGFDVLKYNNKYNDLVVSLGNEYKDFEDILTEQLNDYKRDIDMIAQTNKIFGLIIDEEVNNESK